LAGAFPANPAEKPPRAAETCRAGGLKVYLEGYSQCGTLLCRTDSTPAHQLAPQFQSQVLFLRLKLPMLARHKKRKVQFFALFMFDFFPPFFLNVKDV
jgi:hypothetical protein